MTTSVVTTNNQTLEIDDVMSVVVSPIVDDGTGTGTWVRRIDIFGSPNGANAPATLSVLIKSQTQADLELTTPALQF